MIHSPFARAVSIALAFLVLSFALFVQPTVFGSATCSNAPTITSSDSTTFTVGNSENFTVTTSGGEAPIALYCSVNFPDGVTFGANSDGTGSLYGTPQPGSSGTYYLSIQAASCNGDGAATQQNFTLTVLPELTVTGTVIQSAVGNNFSGQVATFFSTRSSPASDYTATIDWGDGSTPTAGTITGGPGNGPFAVSGSHTYQQAGQFTTSITVTDTTNSATDTGTGMAATSCVPAPDNMISWWRAEGNGTDSRDGNTLSFFGLGEQHATGKVGQAFAFDPGIDGNGDYASAGAPANLAITGQEVTLDGWIKPSSTFQGVYFGKTVGGGNDYCLFNLGGDLTGSVKTDGTPLGETFLHTGYVPAVGQWTHVAMTYDGATLKVYANGVVVGSTPKTGNIVASNSPFDIGGRAAGDLYFYGYIDEVEVFNRALSAEEIVGIYAAGSFGKCVCTPPPTKLAHWWTGDNTAIDIQNSSHGTLKNGAKFAAGKAGQAFSLDGVNDYVDVGDVDLASTFTIDAWINATTLANFPYIITKSDLSTHGYHFGMFSDGHLILAVTNNTGGSTAYKSIDPVITTGGWQHVAATYDGNVNVPVGQRIRLFVNGASVLMIVIADDGGTPANNSVSTKIGIYGDLSSGPFKGLIDEVEIFNRVLNDTEIKAIYDAGGAGKCKSFVLYVANVGNSTIEKFDAAGTDLGLFANSGLDGVIDLAFDVSGNLYAVNDLSDTIEKFDSEGLPTLFASSGLNSPYGLTFDANGNLFVSNLGNNSIEKFNSSGADQGVFANTGLNQPTGLAFDAAGNLYAANDGNSTVRKFNSSGVDQGDFASTGLSSPIDLIFDALGNLYVTNYTGDTIEKFDSSGTDLGAFANVVGSGFYYVVRDPAGNFYVTNANAHAIEKIDITGNGTVFASASTANLSTPTGIAIREISPSATPNPTPTARQLVNISTRASVGTGDNVAIAGLIIHSDPGPGRRGDLVVVAAKRVLIRGIGPSLNITGQLEDPFLELHDSNGALIAFNDNWRVPSQNETDVLATGLAPSNDAEAAIVRTLGSDTNYTAILGGTGDTSGIGLVEVYDLEPLSATHLANLSTRAFVDASDNVLIGGVIIRGGQPQQILFRAIGPSLTGQGVSGALADPQLDIHDTQGTLIAHNDDWMEEPDGTFNQSRTDQINATGLAPTSNSEAAILLVPAPGNYTAIVSGLGVTPTGVGLVEAYELGPPAP
jgi:streptogramin lyase